MLELISCQSILWVVGWQHQIRVKLLGIWRNGKFNNSLEEEGVKDPSSRYRVPVVTYA